MKDGLLFLLSNRGTLPPRPLLHERKNESLIIFWRERALAWKVSEQPLWRLDVVVLFLAARFRASTFLLFFSFFADWESRLIPSLPNPFKMKEGQVGCSFFVFLFSRF